MNTQRLALCMKRLIIFLFGVFQFATSSCQSPAKPPTSNHKIPKMDTINRSDAEWKKELTPEQYYILRQKGTEPPGTGEFNNHFEKGWYCCAGCGQELFDNTQKFDSHCGWPSFDGELGGGERIKKVKDFSHGMIRTEIICARCGGHLGHVFDDGPTQSGLRYCVNSLSLVFKPLKSQ